MKYWQIATGAEGRNYKNLCLKFGVAFVGGQKHKERMEREVNVGDVVVLKHGMKKLIAAGTVREKGEREEVKGWLGDLDGWGADTFCYVDWKLPNSDMNLPARGFTRTTIQQINDREIKEAAKRILETGEANKPEDVPPNPKPICIAELPLRIEKAGLDKSLTDGFKDTIQKIQELAKYYHRLQWGKGNIGRGGEIREHEIRTFMVVPLLLSLGWSEKMLKIELSCQGSKKRVDIACFQNEYNGNHDDCVVVIETKKFITGLDYVKDQALRYQKYFSNCRAIVVTNGYCYKIFEKDEKGKFREEPTAYINLLKPTEKYPLDPDVGGACDALERLLPNRFV